MEDLDERMHKLEQAQAKIRRINASMSHKRSNANELYEADFYQWTQAQGEALANMNVTDLDWKNLAEEILSLGHSDRRGLTSHLQGIVMHLLKWQYQTEGRQIGHSWETSIGNHRDEIILILDDSPSLRRQVPALIERYYSRARRKASRETGLPLATFPETCPWTAEQVMDDDFWPGN